MWKVLTLCIGVLASIPIYGQHRIFLEDGTTIEDAKLHEIRESSILYQKDKSLHDLRKDEINQIMLEEETLTFSEDGTPTYTKRPKVFTSPSFSPSKDRLLLRRKKLFFWNVTELAGFFATAQAGMEWAVKSRLSLVAEGGYIFDSWWRNIWEPNMNPRGWVGRGGVRLYGKQARELFSIPHRHFIEGEIAYREVGTTRPMQTRISVSVVQGKVGSQMILDNGLMIEGNMGMGIQQWNLLAVNGTGSDLSPFPSLEELPTISFGLKLGFASK